MGHLHPPTARRRAGTLVSAVLAALLTIAGARPARAHGGGGGVGAVLVVALVANIALTVIDLRGAALGEAQTTNGGKWESAVGTTEVIGLSIAQAIPADPGEEDAADLWGIFLLSGAAWGGALGAHGWWSLAPPRSPTHVLGVSAVAGVDFALTVASTAQLIKGPFWRKRSAVTEMALALPGLVGTSVAIGTGQAADRPLWIGLTAWSSALVAHGLVSLFARPRPVSDKLVSRSLHVVPLSLPGVRVPGYGVGVVGLF